MLWRGVDHRPGRRSRRFSVWVTKNSNWAEWMLTIEVQVLGEEDVQAPQVGEVREVVVGITQKVWPKIGRPFEVGGQTAEGWIRMKGTPSEEV